MSDRLIQEVIAKAKEQRAHEEALAVTIAAESQAAAAWPTLPEAQMQERAKKVDEAFTKYYNRRTKGWRSSFLTGILKVESYQIPVSASSLNDYVMLGDDKTVQHHEQGLRTKPFGMRSQPVSEKGFQVELGWEVGVAKRRIDRSGDGLGSVAPTPEGIVRIWEVARELQTGTHMRSPKFDISQYGIVREYNDSQRDDDPIDLEKPAGHRVMELLQAGIDFVQK